MSQSHKKERVRKLFRRLRYLIAVQAGANRSKGARGQKVGNQKILNTGVSTHMTG